LRQGVIFDLDERLQATALQQHGHDIRDASVRELQRRFFVDTHQAERVSRVAQALYARAHPDATPEERHELRWACALHEMGMMVSHHDHHRHSAYLLAHVDAAGFSQSQQRRIGELVLGQRGGLRKVEASLTQENFAWQVLCLRLAIIKCHARGEVDAAAMRLTRQGGQALLDFVPGWSESHPRTRHLLAEETAAWERNGPLQLLPRF
jgi:exopolyphosphatase/guanosine-5'-triphosphate,3'-diphosphate pyrophosphatase